MSGEWLSTLMHLLPWAMLLFMKPKTSVIIHGNNENSPIIIDSTTGDIARSAERIQENETIQSDGGRHCD